jgi:hypothetical protein
LDQSRFGQRDRIEGDEELEIGQGVESCHDLVGLGLVAEKDAAGLAVPQLVLDLFGRQRGVHGDIGGGGAEHSQVGDRPFDPVFREDADPVAGRDAQADQPGGDAVGLASDIPVGDVAEAAP